MIENLIIKVIKENIKKGKGSTYLTNQKIVLLKSRGM